MSRSDPVSPCRLQLTPPLLPLRRDLGSPLCAPFTGASGAAPDSAGGGLAGSRLVVVPSVGRYANSLTGEAAGRSN